MPFKSEWVEYPDIVALYQKHGIPATEKKPDGSPHPTLPLIHDASTGRFISDSLLIAKYLDDTYPDTPKLFPPGTDSLIRAYNAAYTSTISPVYIFTFFQTYRVMNTRSLDHFEKKIKVAFGDTKEPQGDERRVQWAKVEQAFGVVASWLGKGDDFVMGSTVSYADIITGGWLVWIRNIFGEDSAEWKQVASWQDGRWAKLVKSLDQFKDADVSAR